MTNGQFLHNSLELIARFTGKNVCKNPDFLCNKSNFLHSVTVESLKNVNLSPFFVGFHMRALFSREKLDLTHKKFKTIFSQFFGVNHHVINHQIRPKRTVRKCAIYHVTEHSRV